MIGRPLRRRVSQLTIRVVLMLAMLIGQAGALSHLYSHVASGQEDPTGLAGGSQACGECLSFAPLVAGGATSEYSLFLTAPIAESLAFVEIEPRITAFPHHAFRSRAPPVRLSMT
jgi:hypothetical protein